MGEIQGDNASYQDLEIEGSGSDRDNKNIERAGSEYDIVMENQIPPKSLNEAIDFSKDSYVLTCPYCTGQCATKMIKKPSTCLYISVILTCVLPPFCLVPFFINSCYDKYHYCTNCSAKVGYHKFFSHKKQ